MATWTELAAEAPALAAFGAVVMQQRPCYLATTKADGTPRVHPVTPVVGPSGLHVFMEPTSPKGADLLARPAFALHNGVPDNEGTGGELLVTGTARLVDDASARAAAVADCTYPVADRYVVFELLVGGVRAKAYGDIALPDPSRWPAPSP